MREASGCFGLEDLEAMCDDYEERLADLKLARARDAAALERAQARIRELEEEVTHLKRALLEVLEASRDDDDGARVQTRREEAPAQAPPDTPTARAAPHAAVARAAPHAPTSRGLADAAPGRPWEAPMSRREKWRPRKRLLLSRRG